MAPRKPAAKKAAVPQPDKGKPPVGGTLTDEGGRPITDEGGRIVRIEDQT